jgi:ArsR family transcriptional regulator, lead/cadmium/zinc/bismuth-responsive transcriptional repressor
MNTHSHESDIGRDGCETFAPDADVVQRVLEALPDAETTRDVAGIFDTLSDPTRLRILQALLAAGELCVCDLATVAGVSSSAVSHQLRLLRDRDLVVFSREGKRAVYRLADCHVATLLAQGLDHAAERRGGGAGMKHA